MNQIPINSKILSISHNDWDGITSQILLGHIFSNITYIHCSFYTVDKILLNTKFEEYDYVFLTDIHPEQKENLYLSNKIILIDHHESAKEYNNPKKGHFVINKSNVSASLLIKRFLENMYGTKLDSLKNLVYLVNDYDCWILKNPKSTLLNEIMFSLYGPDEYRKRFFNGRTKLSNDELKWLHHRRLLLKNIYSNLQIYELNKINGCVLEVTDFFNAIAHKLMNEEKYRIVFMRHPEKYRISIRHNIEKLDIGAVLKDLNIGGGHPLAAGFFVKNDNDFQNKIKTIEEIIFNLNTDARL